MSKCSNYLISIFIFFAFSVTASAACCDKTSKLEWGNSTEVLEYRSCGCADSCWVAEIKSKKTRRLKARLRCNCEKTYFSIGSSKIGGGSERIYENNCSRFENDDKFKAINETMKQLLTHPSSATPNATH
ncbi:MAG: hypothetical protein PHO76_06875 [Methylotenera sp.]|nr:hypothetical protein [Methylotenera sp.]MDD4926390.1 hypothetical protein [Methylotenera sp.]